MPAPTVTVLAPPPLSNSIVSLRPKAEVQWTGGTGPFDVLHEWDTVNTFDSPDLIQDSNVGATSPDTGIPPSDMGPAGTDWFYRVTVTDTDDSTSTTSTTYTLTFFDPVDLSRYLYAYANEGVAFDPTDVTVAGPDDDAYAPDGFTVDFARYIYTLASVGVGFDPTDTPAGGWGPDPHTVAPDGFTVDFARYLYAQAFTTDDVPTPHIWYVYPDFGREGWEFKVIGYGFGDTQATYNGTVLLNALGCSVIDWQGIAETSPDLTIDPVNDIAEPVHQQVRAVVPADAESGLIFICTDA